MLSLCLDSHWSCCFFIFPTESSIPGIMIAMEKKMSKLPIIYLACDAPGFHGCFHAPFESCLRIWVTFGVHSFVHSTNAWLPPTRCHSNHPEVNMGHRPCSQTLPLVTVWRMCVLSSGCQCCAGSRPDNVIVSTEWARREGPWRRWCGRDLINKKLLGTEEQGVHIHTGRSPWCHTNPHHLRQLLCGPRFGEGLQIFRSFTSQKTEDWVQWYPALWTSFFFFFMMWGKMIAFVFVWGRWLWSCLSPDVEFVRGRKFCWTLLFGNWIVYKQAFMNEVLVYWFHSCFLPHVRQYHYAHKFGLKIRLSPSFP